MKSAFIVGPKQIEMREVDRPPVPADGVLMQVKYCGICGSDLRRWKEGLPAGADPIVPGHEAAGIVVEAGKKVTHFKVGDAIAIAPDIHCGQCYYCRRGMYNLCDDLRFIGITPGYPGAFAEFVLLTDEILRNGIVHRLPEGMEYKTAAFAEPCCSVLASMRKLGDCLNQVIVIIGAGPIGCIFAHLAKKSGARVVVSQRSAYRKKMVEAFGPDLVVSPLETDVVRAVREFTHGVGADVVICANPVAETQAQAVDMARKGGRIHLFGGLPKANPMTRLDSNKIHYGEMMVVGDFSYHPSVHESVLQLLHEGVIPAERFISKLVPLESLQSGFEAAAEGTEMKVMARMEGGVS